MNDNAGFIPPHGNYRELLSYRKAEIVQIRRLERDFVQSGGLRERMTRAPAATPRRNRSLGGTLERAPSGI